MNHETGESGQPDRGVRSSRPCNPTPQMCGLQFAQGQIVNANVRYRVAKRIDDPAGLEQVCMHVMCATKGFRRRRCSAPKSTTGRPRQVRRIPNSRESTPESFSLPRRVMGPSGRRDRDYRTERNRARVASGAVVVCGREGRGMFGPRIVHESKGIARSERISPLSIEGNSACWHHRGGFLASCFAFSFVLRRRRPPRTPSRCSSLRKSRWATA